MAARPRADAEPSTFQRRERGRYHEYLDGGERVESVTQLIDGGYPKPGLIQWAADATARYAVDNLAQINELDSYAAYDLLRTARSRNSHKAASRGTSIHSLAEKLNRGEAIDVPEELLTPVEAYLRWMKDYEPQPLIVEGWVINRTVGYAGTLDLLCEIAGIGRVLLDLKTGGKGVFPETALQLAAYRHAERYVPAPGWESPMPWADQVCALWLTPDGSYEMLPVQAGAKEMECFWHCQQTALWAWRAKPIGAPWPPRHPEPDMAASHEHGVDL